MILSSGDPTWRSNVAIQRGVTSQLWNITTSLNPSRIPSVISWLLFRIGIPLPLSLIPSPLPSHYLLPPPQPLAIFLTNYIQSSRGSSDSNTHRRRSTDIFGVRKLDVSSSCLSGIRRFECRHQHHWKLWVFRTFDRCGIYLCVGYVCLQLLFSFSFWIFSCRFSISFSSFLSFPFSSFLFFSFFFC